ncbi:MAG TPA: ribonuclease PH [Candidatus Hydrogenedentes bacterium]|nr:ribonuclease PH [Candidatus Hydrogenedentota bacterium]
MRADGRAPDALRPITIERDFIKTSAGSVLVAFGDTRVVCTANFANRVPAFLRDSGKGWLTAEYGMLPGATPERSERRKAAEGRAQEISRLIGRSLRAVVDLRAVGPCQINVDCDVLQADGGTRTAAITGACVAVYDALRKSVAKGNLPRVPVTDLCAAVSVGLVDGEVLLDLDYREDVAASVDMNVVMNGAGNYIEIQGNAEGAAFPRELLDRMLDVAANGIRDLIARQRRVLDLA